MQIQSARLIIRDFTAEDWVDVHIYASNPQVTEYMIWGPNEESDTQSFVNQQLEHQQMPDRSVYEFAVLLKDTNQLIGGCGLYINASNAEIGYCFHPDYWGSGYGSEAARELLKLAFEQFDVHRVYATCRPMNIGSAKVMRKIGMQKEGHLREHIQRKGKYLDSYLYAILKHEYAGQ